MPIAQINQQIEEIRTLHTITSAFSESSFMKIKMLKQSFEENRIYFDEISQLYRSVKRSANIKKDSSEQAKSKSVTSPKTIHIAITSNHQFYGSLNSDTISEFFEKTKRGSDDRMIIGKTGLRSAGLLNNQGTYDTMIFAQDDPSKDEVDALIAKTASYARVFVYYPKYLNMFNQIVERIDITYSPDSIVSADREIKYIFEPELSKIIAFFELNVRYILFYRVMLETTLARTATRLMSMDAAERKSDELLDSLMHQQKQIHRARINIELLETFSGIIKWQNK